MQRCTLVFPRQWELVWLSRKKKKVGAGFYNGWGGKFDPDDGDVSMEDTAIRELKAETDGCEALPENLKKVAVLDFHKDGEHIFECHVYFFFPPQRLNGEFKETDEMGPGEFFCRLEPPLEEMMPADREWFPRILKGERIRGSIFYNADNTALQKPSEYTVVPQGEPL